MGNFCISVINSYSFPNEVGLLFMALCELCKRVMEPLSCVQLRLINRQSMLNKYYFVGTLIKERHYFIAKWLFFIDFRFTVCT